MADLGLAHLTQHNFSGGNEYRKWELWPIRETRPKQGDTLARLHCGTCGKLV
jgi:hypothetical protein